MRSALKFLYGILPFKKQLYTFLKLLWLPPESVYKHLHFKGVIKVKPDKNASFLVKHYGYQLENNIFWSGLTGGWEKESMKLWIKLCSNASVILDIGANTGIYSLVAKSLNRGAKVYAFEPVQRVYVKLRENIALNGYDIVAFEKAVSNQDGKAKIFDTDTEHVYSVTVNKNLSMPETPVKETEIDTLTLRSFIEDTKPGKIDLIKIDVETHEPEVLEGYLPYLKHHQPSLLIEILNHEVGEKVQALVRDIDYLYFNIDEEGGIRQVDKISTSDYFNYLLCKPSVAKQLGLLK